MESIELARKLAELKQIPEAQNAYVLVLNEVMGKNPVVELEAASYLFVTKSDPQIPLTTFISLYNRGFYQEELMNLLIQAVYLPNINKQKEQYKANYVALQKYSYCFQKDFPDFEDLPILFFPFNEKGYIPFYRYENRFGEYVNFDDTIVRHYFFSDLEKPILGTDVYSQYELEYLNDNVRKSEWVARENHIYLHYTNWMEFCAYAQCLNWRPLLKEEKMVLLFEEEISQYPIDFKERFGIDYSQYPVKPLDVSEIKKLIWHTQLAAHNGGDFFNEIFYGHPNLLAIDSIMLENIKKVIRDVKESWKKGLQTKSYSSEGIRSLSKIKKPVEKDFFVAFFLFSEDIFKPNPAERIVPAVFFQPHFPNMLYEVNVADKQRKWTTLYSEQYEEIQNTPLFQQFKYIKTFTPMRRPTNSYAASNRFVFEYSGNGKKNQPYLVNDLFSVRMLNRSFMIDEEDHLYRDSILVRFEDGKLNPKATFTALAKFLDIPYTESMTYCSNKNGINPEALPGNARGFDPITVYKTYDEYANDSERAYLEYMFRDAYEYYGYNFMYYQGDEVDEQWLRNKLDKFTCVNQLIESTWRSAMTELFQVKHEDREHEEEVKKVEEVKHRYSSVDEAVQDILKKYDELRFEYGQYMLKKPYFFNRRGQLLKLMPKLELDPDLLEQPLYH